MHMLQSGALFQDRNSQTMFYYPFCAWFATEKTADVALKDLLVIFESTWSGSPSILAVVLGVCQGSALLDGNTS
jgi:hypothetical protein